MTPTDPTGALWAVSSMTARSKAASAVQRAPARRLLGIHAVTVAGRPTPAQAVRIGDTIKLQVDSRSYDVTVTKGLLP